jgi:4'-phosphopantetheinyl transferase
VIATLHANAPRPWPLRDDVVHVWRFACQQDVGRAAEALSEDERARAARFVFRQHREAYVVQHAMMRALLARYLEIAPARVELGSGRFGKPHLIGRELELNLSHTDDVALLAVAHLPVGVDIERLAAPIDPDELGDHVLAPAERATGLTRRGFLRIWCRKEACLKATGIGLVDDLPSISVADDRVDVAGEIVHVQDLDMGPAHAAALATASPCAQVGAAELEVLRVTS